jgi:hypothetical protein
VDSTSVTIDGWTTGAGNYIKVYTPVTTSEAGASQRHTGKWGDGYRITGYLIISDEYVRIDGMSVWQSAANRIYFITGSAGVGEIQMSNCFGWNTSSDAGAFDVFDLWSTGALVVKYWNCIGINDSTNAGADAFYFNSAPTTTYCYNCTGIANAGHGFYTWRGTVSLKNCLGYSTTATAFQMDGGAGDTVNYSASDDVSAIAIGGTGNRISQTFSFVNAGGGDYHIKPTDAGARNYGTDLSADATIPFSTDIDDDTRPLDTTWDIGADEADAVNIYRSVGTTATDLNTSSQTVTISGDTATFSNTMPNNVGVGDALVYGSTNIAFISGRTSGTVFTLQDATGGSPIAAAAGTSVAIYRPYQSLAGWEANTLGQENSNIDAAVDDYVILASTDLVTLGHIMMVPCYADGDDSTAVTIDGWTTGASTYIKIYTPIALSEAGISQRHSGTWGNGYRRSGSLVVSDEYVRLDGLSVYKSTSGRTYEFTAFTSVGELWVSNCFGWYGANDANDVFDFHGTTFAVTVKIWNCIGYTSSTDTTSEAFYFNSDSYTVYAYNCTGIANAGRAFQSNTAVNPRVLKNCLGYSASGASFNGSYTSVTYSASDDATADDWAGAGNRISQTFTFMDSANNNYHLAASDAGARNYGTNLSADATIPFAVDIDGDSRAIGSAWDIGADEAYELVNIYRSVGITATDLKTAASTVTISGTTATFSTAQPNNMGVGDAVVYGSTYIAFISGRTSSTVFTVQNATGGTPTAAAAGTSVAVYRVYQSLAAWEANTLDQENSNINAAVDDGVILASTNLVTSGYIMMVPCYADGEDVTAVTVDGWTTGASNYIKIYTPSTTAEAGVTQRHNGTWGNGFRMSSPLIVSDNYVRLDGLSMVQRIVASRGFFVSNITGTGEIHISNCFSWVENVASSRDGFDFLTLDAVTVKIWNNIAISDSTDTGSYGYIFNDVNITVYSYNNTAIVNGGKGFMHPGATVYIKNCLSQSVSGVAYALSGGTYNMEYSASDDGTADDWGGTGNRVDQTFTFVDAANDNFHIAATDAGAREYGTNLSADAIIPFSTDIDGGVRPIGAAWDMGADETLFPGTGGFMAIEY